MTSKVNFQVRLYQHQSILDYGFVQGANGAVLSGVFAEVVKVFFASGLLQSGMIITKTHVKKNARSEVKFPEKKKKKERL